MAIERLQEAGYVYIGMDHFAKPDDTLVLAQQQGRLQRNFQGYSTHGNCDLLSFGASAISYFGGAYIQNAKRIEDCQQAIDTSGSAFLRGVMLSREDHLRQFLINHLICHFHIEFSTLRNIFSIDPQRHFASELAQLDPMVKDGLLTLDERGIRVHNAGRMLIRRICMVFDEYLNTGRFIRYSKVI